MFRAASVCLLLCALTGAARAEDHPRLRIGDTLPDLVVQRLAGEPLHLSSLHGEAAVIAVYSSFCEPCHRMLPIVVKLVDQINKQANIRIPLFVIAVDGNVEQDLVARYGPSITWLLDHDGAAQAAFDPQTLPCTFLADDTGTVRHINRGYGQGYEKRVGDWLRALVTH